jgi:hypothetical protein
MHATALPAGRGHPAGGSRALDHASINAIEDYQPSGLPREARALLIIEVDGLQ